MERAPERTVILGARGFVGAAASERLRAADVPVLGLGRDDIDLLSDGAAERLSQTLRPGDSVVVVSARAPVRDNRMLEENVRMMSAVCGALEKVDVAHVVYVSSDAVYADSMQPIDERSCAEPASLHGVMHLAREVMLRTAYDGPLAMLRPSLLYGADDPHNGYGPNRFRRQADEGQDIVLFGEGEELRDHVLIDDVAELVRRVVMHMSTGILNVATGNVTSFREIADLVAALAADGVAVRGTPRQGPMPHNGYRAFDPAATHAAFPDFRYTPIEEGVAAVAEQLRARATL